VAAPNRVELLQGDLGGYPGPMRRSCSEEIGSRSPPALTIGAREGLSFRNQRRSPALWKRPAGIWPATTR
jgi:hypothetical protein